MLLSIRLFPISYCKVSSRLSCFSNFCSNCFLFILQSSAIFLNLCSNYLLSLSYHTSSLPHQAPFLPQYRLCMSLAHRSRLIFLSDGGRCTFWYDTRFLRHQLLYTWYLQNMLPKRSDSPFIFSYLCICCSFPSVIKFPVPYQTHPN